MRRVTDPVDATTTKSYLVLDLPARYTWNEAPRLTENSLRCLLSRLRASRSARRRSALPGLFFVILIPRFRDHHRLVLVLDDCRAVHVSSS
jgi:hypothetical protein